MAKKKSRRKAIRSIKFDMAASQSEESSAANVRSDAMNTNGNKYNIQQELENFFRQVFESPQYQDVTYKVLMSERAQALFEAAHLPESETISNTLMTPTGLLLRLDEFEYTHLTIPKILLIDDTDFYGRNISTFIEELIKMLVKRCPYYDDLQIRTDVLSSVYVEDIFPKKYPLNNIPWSLPLELGPHYNFLQRPLLIKTKSDYNWTLGESTDYLVSSGQFMTPSLPSVRMSTKSAERFFRAVERAEYQPQEIGDERIFVKNLSSDQSIKAIATIRSIPCGEAGYCRVVPHLFCADFNKERFSKILRILDELFQLKFRGKAGLSSLLVSWSYIPEHSLAEIVARLLNYLLLQHFLSVSQLRPEEYENDLGGVIQTFGGDAEARRFIQDFREKAENAQVECFDRVLAVIMHNEDSLPKRGVTVDKSEAQSILEESLFKKAMNIERANYCSIHGGMRHSIATAGATLVPVKFFARQTEVSAYQIPLWLLYFADKGYCTFEYYLYSSEARSKDCFWMWQMVKITDPARLIWPRKYAAYLPLICAITTYCLWGWDDISRHLENFLGKDDKALLQDLGTLVYYTYRSGNDIKDWLKEVPRDDPMALEFHRFFLRLD